MNGRLEKELQAEDKMNRRLKKLPFIFTEFYYYMKPKKSYNTIERYIEYVVDFMEYVTAGKNDNEFYKNIKPQIARQYVVSLERKVVDGELKRMGAEMQATRWSAINAFFKFLVMDEYLDVNPMLKTERPKVKVKHTINYLKPDEIAMVLEQVSKDANPRLVNRDLCLISLILSTGLRVAAASQINIEDIDFTTNQVRVIEKGDVDRWIPITIKMRGNLLNWMKDRELYFNGEASGPLFISQHHKRLSVDAIRDLVDKYTTCVGRHIKVHDLRKSTATNLAAAGVDVRTIQDILGHQNLQTTMRYVDVLDEHKKQAVDILNKLI